MHTTIVIDTDTGDITISDAHRVTISLNEIDRLITYMNIAGTKIFDKAGIMVYKITLEGLDMVIEAATSRAIELSRSKG